MAYAVLSFLAATLSLSRPTVGIPTDRYCKPQSTDAHWPSPDQWQALNASLAGRLLVPTPPAAVCHSDWPQYANASCDRVVAQWSNKSFHALDPVSVDYNDGTCLPDALMPCSADGYSRFVVEARCAEDVACGVRFAAETGVRLVVKGTGHDFPGRSSGPESLSIYMHGVRGIGIEDFFQSNAVTQPAATVKISAGERMGDINAFAVAKNLTIVGGGDPNVGIAGWVSGGGHGPLTALYGLGADQVVEMDIVTADGKFRTINDRQDSDLFWAVRGAGGSTLGVIISVTVKAYPPLPATVTTFAYNTTADSDSFWSMVARFSSKIPQLCKVGLMGYYHVYPRVPGETNASIAGGMFGSLFAPNMSIEEVASILAPLEEAMCEAEFDDPTFVSSNSLEVDQFMHWYTESSPPQSAGVSGRLGSRLLDERALSADTETVKAALKKSNPAGDFMLGHMVAGPGAHNPPDGIPGGSNAVGPGWRSAYSHVVLPRPWTPLNEMHKRHVTQELRDVQVEALRQLSPDAGAYVNEVDPTEPDWQRTLYGENYLRLLEAKTKWDPTGVFWCKHCVGSERWETIGGDGVENGVGQSDARLCRG